MKNHQDQRLLLEAILTQSIYGHPLTLIKCNDIHIDGSSYLKKSALNSYGMIDIIVCETIEIMIIIVVIVENCFNSYFPEWTM